MDFIEITHFVNLFSEASQLQSIKTYRTGDAWLLGLEFYPEPRSLLIGLSPENQRPSFALKASRAGLTHASHPVQLYLRAHFQNQRVASVKFEGARFELNFLPSQAQWQFEISLKGELKCEMRVPERKAYFQTLALGLLPMMTSHDPQTDATARVPEAPESSAQKKAEAKKTRMLKNVQADCDAAENWLKNFESICQVVAMHPDAWIDGKPFSDEQRALLQSELMKGELPPFGRAHLAQANEALFSQRRKSQKRVEGARKRWQQVNALPLSRFEAKIRASQGELKEKAKGRKAPGLWFELRNNFWVRIGRSATENAELFRQARDRDLWFHVRGEAGGHVWVPRGQPAFGAKEDPPDWLLDEGAMLAVFNSKARSSGSAFVDFTERRHLRSIKGASPGTLEIVRSQTRHVRLDPAFESRLNRK